MGIQGLTSLIKENAPKCIQEYPLSHFFGRKVAIDASMSLYQFLIAIRLQDVNPLTDSSGQTTSHLQGLFYRTIRMVENGLKPVFVFDGKAPQLKSEELEKRRNKREEAIKSHVQAKEEGQEKEIAKFAKRMVKISKEEIEDSQTLLRLMGLPVLQAPGEAEAYCAALAKEGIVYATGSEDMDSLTFGTPILLRNLTASEFQKVPIRQLNLTEILQSLQLSMDQFIDLCILLGCDYCDSIRGIGKKRALQFIKKYGNIESILQNLSDKYKVPENFPYQETRKIFKEMATIQKEELPNLLHLEWKEPDEEGIEQFLVKEKGFNEERVKNSLERMKKAKQKALQSRITSFFSPKRKAEDMESSQ